MSLTVKQRQAAKYVDGQHVGAVLQGQTAKSQIWRKHLGCPQAVELRILEVENRTLEDEFPKWAFSTSRIVGESVLCKPTLKAQRGLLTDSEYESTFGFRLSTVKSCMFPPCCDAWSKHLLCLSLVYACSAHHALDEQSQIHGNSESDSRHRPKVLPSEQLIEPVSH